MTANPTLRRRRLAAELRRLRADSGMTGDEVAESLLISTSKLSRIETGHRTIYPRDVRSLLDVYGVTDEEQRSALMELASKGRHRDWWSLYSDLMPGPYLGLEAEADSICNYQTLMVPGLLQTEEYARALMGAALVSDEAEVERRAGARMQRQSRLTETPPLKLWAVLDEAVLRRHVAGRDVMYRQLEHLAERARLPNVTIQVLPFEAGAYLAIGLPMVILSFPEHVDSAVVMVENILGELYLEKPEEVSRFQTTFDHLRAAAVSPEQSLKLINKAARSLKES